MGPGSSGALLCGHAHSTSGCGCWCTSGKYTYKNACHKTYVSVFFQWTYYQRRKMFYDESWIIDYNDIRKGTLVAMHSKCLAFNNFLLLLQIMAMAVS